MTLRVLIVDDEALARARLRTLLGDCTAPRAVVVGEAGQGAEALEHIARIETDVVLLDIHMPGMNGIALAEALRVRADAPAVVFVTAHTAHAVTAFELDVADYLTKPVRLERLQQALQKVERHLKERRALQADSTSEMLLIQDRGRAERVPISDVLYLKSELKYLTVRTATRTYIFDGALADFEARHAGLFLRVHRNALVARHAIRLLEKHDDAEEADGWALRLAGIPEPVAVSRRQLPAVREVMKERR